MLERQIKDYLVKRCLELEIYHRKFTSPGCSGVPDWILVNNGKVIFLELKATGKKPSPLQEREINRINNHGGFATCASTKVEIEFLISYLIEKEDDDD